MLFKCDCEFRGHSIKSNDKGTYHYVSIETANEDGEALKLSADDLGEKYKQIKKGDKIIAFIDYSIQYKSLKVVDIERVVNNGK